MTDTERIAALEAAIEQLKLRDERRENEHRRLLESREELRRDMEQDYTFLGRAFDQRINELVQRGGSDGYVRVADLLPLLELFGQFRDLVLRELSEHRERLTAEERILEKQIAALKQLAEWLKTA